MQPRRQNKHLKSTQKYTLKSRALHYLSLREQSRLELKRKLMRHADEGDDVEALLNLLEASNLLSSERFSEALVRRRLSNYGSCRILTELQTHGINPHLLAQTKASLIETEVQRARQIWQRKFGQQDGQPCMPQIGQFKGTMPPEQRARQIRFLVQRGFSLDVIRAALREELENQDMPEIEG